MRLRISIEMPNFEMPNLDFTSKEGEGNGSDAVDDTGVVSSQPTLAAGVSSIDMYNNDVGKRFMK